MVQKRISNAVDRVLKEKGYELIEGEDADFAITMHAGAKERMQIQNWGRYSVAYSPWWVPYGGQTDVSYFKEGTLVIDIVNMENEELA